MKARACLPLLALLASLLPASAVSISLVYQNPADPFFTTAAKSTMTKAAADLSFAITTSLNSLSQDVYVGTNGGTNVTANWSLSYTDPTTGNTTITLPTFALGIDEIRIYVGSRNLGGSILGVGGAGGAGFGLGFSGFESQLIGATNAMEASSNTGMVRGGPVVNTLSGNLTSGATSAPYNLSYGYAVSSLSINSTAAWNLDYNVTSFAGLNDLYSVALHEMFHSIGFGVGSTWISHASGNNWNGAAVIGLEGTGVGVLEGGAHIASGLTGKPLVEGVFQAGNQEALMDPSITTGTRKYITDLDLAFMQDMGWNVQAVPEPSAVLLVLAGAACFALRRGSARSR